jgi:hypothetical protein
MMHLDVAVCYDAADAIDKGYMYRNPEYKAAVLKKAVVVQHGTMAGNATVDLIFEDSDGQKHVALITAALLRSIPIGN